MTLPVRQSSVYCKCDGSGWVYLPVRLSGWVYLPVRLGCWRGVVRVRCNCKAGVDAR